FFSPSVEDAAHGRILTFRDGPRGLFELPVVAGGGGSWQQAKLGSEGVGGTQVFPYPSELLSAEHIYLDMRTDPTTRTFPQGSDVWGPIVLPQDAWRIADRTLQSLWWPFQVLNDPVNKRVRVLTHRGVLWELGAELRQGPGDPCTSD